LLHRRWRWRWRQDVKDRRGRRVNETRKYGADREIIAGVAVIAGIVSAVTAAIGPAISIAWPTMPPAASRNAIASRAIMLCQ